MVDKTPEPWFRHYYRPILIFSAGAILGLVAAQTGGWRVVQAGDHFDLRLFDRTVGTWRRSPELVSAGGFLGLCLAGGLLAVGAYLLGRLLGQATKEK